MAQTRRSASTHRPRVSRNKKGELEVTPSATECLNHMAALSRKEVSKAPGALSPVAGFNLSKYECLWDPEALGGPPPNPWSVMEALEHLLEADELACTMPSPEWSLEDIVQANVGLVQQAIALIQGDA